MSRNALARSALAGAGAMALIGAFAPRPAAANDFVIGGHAQLCAHAAKAGLSDPDSIEVCTIAITGETITGHELAATYVNRGTMFLGAANYGAAMHDFDSALAIEPGLGEAYVNRGGALIGMRRYREALAEIDRGLALNPMEPEKAYGNRALAKWSLDDLRGAYQDFMKAQELKPDWAWPKEQLAHFTVKAAKEQ